MVAFEKSIEIAMRLKPESIDSSFLIEVEQFLVAFCEIISFFGVDDKVIVEHGDFEPSFVGFHVNVWKFYDCEGDFPGGGDKDDIFVFKRSEERRGPGDFFELEHSELELGVLEEAVVERSAESDGSGEVVEKNSVLKGKVINGGSW